MKFATLIPVLLLLCSTHAAASDVGLVQLPNSGKSAAQSAFLHGLAQLHNFEYSSAAEDFRHAQEIDPGFALAYWGEAMSHNHTIWMRQDREAGRAALLKLAASQRERLRMADTNLEKDFLQAVQVLYGDGDKQSRDFLYRDHMQMMVGKYPGNPEVGAFYALSIMGTAHSGRDFTLYMKAAAVTTELFASYPQHPGLAHYLIHSTDDSIHAPLGYNAALAYSRIAPNAAHAQHMTSHIFLALGHWQATADANDNAVAVVNRQRSASDEPSLGCGHYPSWQMYAYLQQGRVEEATTRMKLCHQRTTESSGNRQSLLAFYYMKELYLFDTEDWDGDVARTQVDHQADVATEFFRLYLDAAVALHTAHALQNAPAHQNESSAGQRLTHAAVEAGERYLAYLKEGTENWDARAASHAQIRIMHLKGWMAAQSGKDVQAESHWREAVAMENELPFGFGPPNPAKPTLEALGEFLLAQGRYVEAEDIFRKALARTLNRTRTKRGLLLAVEGSSGNEDIAQADQE